MDSTRVLYLFGLFSDLPSVDLAPWEGLCTAALLALQGQLKEGTNTTTHAERLNIAAAAFAYADYLLLGGSANYAGEALKIGDISVGSTQSQGENRQDSQNIRAYFTHQIADLIRPAFVFTTTGGADHAK